MKIIALLASPHGLKGNTAALLSYVVEGVESEGGTVETVVLKGDSVLPCMACDICHKKGRCVQKDDFESIKAQILSSDGLILASPNYIFNVSAQMKAFMDRCCGVVHCMQFWGKYGASIVTSGGAGEEPVAEYMSHFLITSGAVPVGAVTATMTSMQSNGFNGEVREQARTLGRKIVNSWRAGDVPAGVNEQRNTFRERMRELMAYRKNEWPFECRYWQEGMGL
jgi:multimeric flavodoxin WrbA